MTTISRFSFLFIVLLAGCSAESGPGFRSVLWYDAPAKDWSSEALPVGNGRLGAMVFGDPYMERIQLNEDSMWPGGPDWGNAQGSGADLDEVRQMLVDGKVHEADAAWVDRFSHKSIVRSHQTMGDLWLDFSRDSTESVWDYRRQLDLDSALVSVQYTTSEGTFTEKVLTSQPANAIVVELTTTSKSGLSFDIKLTRPQDSGQETVMVQAVSDSELIMEGMVTQWGGQHFSEPNPIARGVEFQTRLMALNTGGEIEGKDGMLSVRGAQRVVLHLVAATTFYEDDVPAKNQSTLSALSGRSFDQILEEDVADYRPLFNRVVLDLGGHELDSLTTPQRLERIKQGEPDNGLTALEFQMGRYLLISSSRPGTNPANLQGLWNEYIKAPWNADYHLNINLQMNYWLAEVTNLSEMHEPLFDFTERLMERGKETARLQYGMRGAVAHHATDLWAPALMRAATPYWGFILSRF